MLNCFFLLSLQLICKVKHIIAIILICIYCPIICLSYISVLDMNTIATNTDIFLLYKMIVMRYVCWRSSKLSSYLSQILHLQKQRAKKRDLLEFVNRATTVYTIPPMVHVHDSPHGAWYKLVQINCEARLLQFSFYFKLLELAKLYHYLKCFVKWTFIILFLNV